MSRTIVGVNTLTAINEMAYNSHCQEWYRMGKDFPTDEFIFWTPRRTSIDNMRNESVKVAIDNKCDYIYFIDDDMLLSPGTYKSLREAMDRDKEKNVAVMAQTFIRAYPYEHMCFIDPDDKGFLTERKAWEKLVKFNDYDGFVTEDGLLRCDAIGCATVLLNVEIVKKIERRPLFQTVHDFCTEDVYFCALLQHQLGRENLQFLVDLRVPTRHILDPEVISVDNVKLYRDRGAEDIKKCQPPDSTLQ